MKKALIISVIITSLAVPGLMRADVYTTMKPVMDQLYDYLYFLEDSVGAEIVTINADIITDDGVAYTRYLFEGWEYGITAFGDWRVEDLDIVVYWDNGEEWIEVVSDEEVDNNPTVFIVPEYEGSYLIEIYVYSWSGDYSTAHYGLMIFHE